MSTLMRAVRFVVGLSLLAAGVVAAGPYTASLVAAHGRRASVEPAAETIAWSPRAADVTLENRMGVEMPFAATPPQLPQAAPAPVFAQEGPEAVSAPIVPRGEYRPPAPPARLPAASLDLSRRAPPLDAAYRSTLDVPPPPLLDAASPPPLAVAWSATAAHAGEDHAVAGPLSDSSPAYTTYSVRDGDDLTQISVRLYGHAGGAQAIWSVNRDRLADPNLLPIGLELRIPPAWSVPAIQRTQVSGRLIEPDHRPAQVRVAPGETLESLARRFYGDPAMASRVFEANRDRLRDPRLLVAGMELRLP